MSSCVQQIDNGTIETFPDGTRIQKTNDGVTLMVKIDGTKIQSKPDGSRLTVSPDGTRFQESADGSTLYADCDGVQTTTYTNGIEVILYPDGRKKQTDEFGVVVDVAVNGDQIQTNLDGTKYETRGTRSFKHLADGSILERDPSTGAIIGVERAASTPEAEATVNEANAAKKLKKEELKSVYQTNLSRHRDQTSGAWYEHDKLTGQTRWLTTAESEEQMQTDEVAKAMAAMRMAEARADDIETKSKHTLEDMSQKLNENKQHCQDLEQQVVLLQEDVQRRHNAHHASHQQFEAHMADTVKELNDEIKTLVAQTQQTDSTSDNNMEFTTLQNKYRSLRIANENIKTELATTKGTLQATAKRLNTTTLQLKDFKTQISTNNEASKALSRKYEEVVDRAGLLAEEMTVMQATMDTSADTYANSLQDIGRLQATLVKTTKERDEALSGEGGEGKGVATSTSSSSDLESKMLAAERTCQATLKKLSAIQQENGQQRALLDEMQMRRESSDTMMRQQRTALKEYKGQVEKLRDDLRKEASRHAYDSQQHHEHTKELKNKLHLMYDALDKKVALEEVMEKKLDQLQQEREQQGLQQQGLQQQEQQPSGETSSSRTNSLNMNAAGETMKQQSGRIYELTIAMTEKDELIATLRDEIASLHKKVSSLEEHAGDSRARGRDSNAIAMSAMSFFDMDNTTGLHLTSDAGSRGQQPPPPPSSSPTRRRRGARHPSTKRKSIMKRNSSMGSFGSQTFDQDNIERLISLRDASRIERSAALKGLLDSHKE